MNRDTQFTNMLKEASLKRTDKDSRTSGPTSLKERAFDVSATSSSTSSIQSSHDESKDSDHKSVHINL